MDERARLGETDFDMPIEKPRTPKKRKAAMKAAGARRRTTAKKRGRTGVSIPRDRKAFVRMLRPLVRDLVAEAVEDHLDVIESIEALKDSGRVSHEDLVRGLGR